MAGIRQRVDAERRSSSSGTGGAARVEVDGAQLRSSWMDGVPPSPTGAPDKSCPILDRPRRGVGWLWTAPVGRRARMIGSRDRDRRGPVHGRGAVQNDRADRHDDLHDRRVLPRSDSPRWRPCGRPSTGSGACSLERRSARQGRCGGPANGGEIPVIFFPAFGTVVGMLAPRQAALTDTAAIGPWWRPTARRVGSRRGPSSSLPPRGCSSDPWPRSARSGSSRRRGR